MIEVQRILTFCPRNNIIEKKQEVDKGIPP